MIATLGAKVCRRCGRVYTRGRISPKQFARSKFCSPRCNHPAPARLVRRGYVFIYQPAHPHATRRGYVREHRLVVERALGKVLRPSADVHHVNGKRDDNRASNLVACDSRGYHRVLHLRMQSRARTLRLAGFQDDANKP